MGKRTRRSFSKEYKGEVVKLIRRGGKSVGAVSRELDLTETAVRRWVSQAEIDSSAGPAGALTTDERRELAELRKRVKTLEMEREILKKATVDSIGECNIIRFTRIKGDVASGSNGTTGSFRITKGGSVATVESGRVPERHWSSTWKARCFDPLRDPPARGHRPSSTQALPPSVELGRA